MVVPICPNLAPIQSSYEDPEILQSLELVFRTIARPSKLLIASTPSTFYPWTFLTFIYYLIN